jgi:hypothetical protein
MKQVAVILTVLALSACSDEPTARRVLTKAGYTDIEITGFDVLMCGHNDTRSTGFRATSPSGRHVKGAVCTGWDRGYIIAFR